MTIDELTGALCINVLNPGIMQLFYCRLAREPNQAFLFE